jgi:hypothetical protein
MPMFDQSALGPPPALVTRYAGGGERAPRYLQLTPLGGSVWTEDPEAATAFASMREATRFASRLPAALRAFGLPRGPEVTLHRVH